MEKFYTDCLERFSTLHKEIKSALDGLPAEALDWYPAEETNSINVLVVHLASAERFWAADVPLGQDSDRVRAEEFKTAGLTTDELDAHLDDTLAAIEAGFNQMTLTDLEEMRYSRQHDMHVTAAWAILHALDHSAMHVGHIQLTRQWWEASVKN